MSQQTITLLFLVFTIISFILEKIPLGLTASICAIGLTLTGVVDVYVLPWNTGLLIRVTMNGLRKNFQIWMKPGSAENIFCLQRIMI